MKYPLITVGITSYNHAAYVEMALESILKEDYPNKEIVIIDDGSGDGSPIIIQKWKEKNDHLIPIIFKSRPNKGLTVTLNEILESANGDFIAYLASDDLLWDNGLSKRMKLAQTSGKSLIVADSSVINAQGIITHQSWMRDFMKVEPLNYRTETGIMKEVLEHPAISGSVPLVHRSIYDKIGKYPADFYAEEWFLYQRAAALRLMAYLDESVSLYRRHDSNTSGTDFTNRKHLISSIIKSYRMNWRLFPGKLKLLALKQWLRWIKTYTSVYILKRK